MMKRRGEREALPLPLYQQKSVFLGLSFYVDQDSYHDDNALDDLLPVGRYAHDVQTVCDNGDEQTADDNTPRLANAAGHGYAADNARRDGIHLVALSCGRLADGNAGGHQEAAQTSQQAGNGERGDADRGGVDARNAGCLQIAAAGVNTSSVNRFR